MALTAVRYDEEKRVREMIEYNLTFLEYTCAIAKTSIRNWDYDYLMDGAVNRILNGNGNGEFQAAEVDP